MAYYRAVTQVTASIPERIGVLLVNLGTPDSPTYFAVQRYLREFLSDRRVINTAPALWLPILYGIVLPLRPLPLRRTSPAREASRWFRSRTMVRRSGCPA